MLLNFFGSTSPRKKELARRVRLGIERLESRDCPSALILNESVLPNHVVNLTGTLLDTQPVGAVITFSGAVSGQTTVKAGNTFSFSTDNASLGAVSAVAVDQAGQSSNIASALLTLNAPVVYLELLQVTDTTATLAGNVQGLDPAGQSISLTGAASGSGTTDANGDFIITAPLSGTGAIDATTTNLWGQSSNTAVVIVTTLPPPPTITLNAQVLPGHEAELTGTVTGENPAGVVVTFSGAVSGTAVTDANGNFTYFTQAASLGTVTAVGVDQLEESTNVASATLAVDAPTVTVSILIATADTVTLFGTVTDLDSAGQIIAISGVASANVITNANGNFLLTTSQSGSGTIQATATDLWGQTSDPTTATLTPPSPTGGPMITFDATVLPGHELLVTGNIVDSNPAGIAVTLTGAVSGSTTTNSKGNFSFTTTDAQMGTICAIATDSQNRTSSKTLSSFAAPPTIIASISASSASTVTISGTVNDVDANGETVTYSGAATGSVVCDGNGYFSFTVAASLVGDIELTTTDDWGQTSAQADVELTAEAPEIINFSARDEAGGNVWVFTGQVLAAHPAQLDVNLGGLRALLGVTSPTDANGMFCFSCTILPGVRGTAWAVVTDQTGLSSNTVYISVAT